MGAHGLKLAQVPEFVLEEGGPPTDGQVLAVHTVLPRPLCHPEEVIEC